MLHLNGFFQNAYVTRNLDKAVDSLRTEHGIKDFIFFEPEMHVDTIFGSGPIQVKVALCWAGETQIEMIEPVSGKTGVDDPYLPADDSPRFHHIGTRVLDWDVKLAEIAREKLPIAYQGEVPGCKFIYIDTRPTLGHYTEYLWASEELWAGMGGPQA